MGLVFKRTIEAPAGLQGIDPTIYRKQGLVRRNALVPEMVQQLQQHLYEDHGLLSSVPQGKITPLNSLGKQQFPFATHVAPSEMADFLRMHAEDHIKMGHDPDNQVLSLHPTHTPSSCSCKDCSCSHATPNHDSVCTDCRYGAHAGAGEYQD